MSAGWVDELVAFVVLLLADRSMKWWLQNQISLWIKCGVRLWFLNVSDQICIFILSQCHYLRMRIAGLAGLACCWKAKTSAHYHQHAWGRVRMRWLSHVVSMHVLVRGRIKSHLERLDLAQVCMPYSSEICTGHHWLFFDVFLRIMFN